MMNLCMPLLYWKSDFNSWLNNFYSWEQDCCYISILGDNTAIGGCIIGKFKYKNKQDLPFVYAFVGEHAQQGEPTTCDNSDDSNHLTAFKIYQWGNRDRKVLLDVDNTHEIFRKYTDVFGWNPFTTRKVFIPLKDAERISKTYFDPEGVYNAIKNYKTLNLVSRWPSNVYGFFNQINTCQSGDYERYFSSLGYPPDIYKYNNYAYTLGAIHFDTEGYSWSGNLGIEFTYSG